MTAVYRVYKDNTLMDNYITDLTILLPGIPPNLLHEYPEQEAL